MNDFKKMLLLFVGFMTFVSIAVLTSGDHLLPLIILPIGAVVSFFVIFRNEIKLELKDEECN